MDLKIDGNIIKGIISGKKKDGKFEKGKLQRISINGKDAIQLSLFTKTQVFHSNLSDDNIIIRLVELLESSFNNLEVFTNDYVYSFRVSAKGKLLSNKRKNNESLVKIEHNKKKNYIIEENKVIPALVDLGVMLPDGRIVKSSYDKYKQINRFLEIIDDCIKEEKELNIIDFGCGKSYLTFILYHYLVNIKGIKCNVLELDLKEDVIKNCNKLAEKYGYTGLKFLCGDIAKYANEYKVDMIITLHACDTATDYALYHAINLGCKYIFSVPCCQHEINSQLDPSYLHPINKFGILKERFSAIATDAIRANILQYFGYKTQVMEFVDLENSPKNLLIRAVLTNNKNENAKKEIDELIEAFKIEQTLYKLVFKKQDRKVFFLFLYIRFTR